ncbi:MULTISPECIES: site-specific integrase [Methylotenera]|uniref:site-specific integrase n=1 Tax=Methylotenera TaxID=359407 RepID=UPI0003697246|nr:MULTISPECIES: site-specific integrase [Methylotenera]
MLITKNIWYLGNHPLYERKNKLDWGKFHFDRINSKYEKYELRKSAKKFLYVFFVNTYPDEQNPGTLNGWANHLRLLIRWMISHNIYRFKDLSEKNLCDYLLERVKENQNKLSKKSIRKHITLFEKLWEFRFQYPSPLQVDPSKIETFFRILKKGSNLRIWNSVPIEVTLPLVKDAMQWIENDAEDTLNIIALNNANRGNLVGLTKDEMYKKCNKALEIIFYSHSEFKQLQQILSLDDETPKDVLRQSIKLSVGAAIVIILFFTGVRVSELLSFKMGCCIERTHVDGQKYWYIQGIGAKKNGLAREWVIPLPVVSAVNFLERLHSALIPDNKYPHLFEFPCTFATLPYPYIQVKKYWSSDIGDLMRLFSNSNFRIPSTVIGHTRLHPHQARKTFAKFVVLRDKRGLEALAQHYGHLYIAILDKFYVGTDFELHNLIDEESQKDLEAGLNDLLSCETLGGKAGEKLTKIREKANTKYRGRSVLNSIVKMMIKEGVILAPCDWGYCVYSKDQSACKGTDTAPNPIFREPNTCVNCNNFAVTQKHKKWWEDRVIRDEEFLKQQDLPIQTITIVKSRLDKSINVLQKLTPDFSNKS